MPEILRRARVRRGGGADSTELRGAVLLSHVTRAGPGAARAAGTIPIWRRACIITREPARTEADVRLAAGADIRTARACDDGAGRVRRRLPACRQRAASWRTAFRRRRPTSLAEAQFFPPPFEEYWTGHGDTRPMPVVPPAHLPGVVRVDDGQRLARPGLARRVSALGAPDLDRRRLRRCPTPPDGTARARHNPFAVPGRMRLPVRPRHAAHALSPPGLAARRLLLALPHAEQLRGQRSAARRRRRSAVGPGARPPGARLQPDV